MRGRRPEKLTIARRDQDALHSAAHSGSAPWFQVQRAKIVLAIAAVVIIAIFFRPGGFSVEAQGQGVTLKLAFDDSRVDLSEFLGQLLRRRRAEPTPIGV